MPYKDNKLTGISQHPLMPKTNNHLLTTMKKFVRVKYRY